VHVIGKDDESVDCKRAGAPDMPHSIAQVIDAIGEQRVAAPLQKIDGEEEATARHAQSTGIRHGSGITSGPAIGAHIRRITPEGQSDLQNLVTSDTIAARVGRMSGA